MADEIKFEAQVGKWVCVKKGKIEEGCDKIEASRVLASIHDSMDRKIWECLGDEIKIKEIDKIAGEIAGATYNEKKEEWKANSGKVTEAMVAEALGKCGAAATTKRLKETIPENKFAIEIAKTYLTRRVIDLIGLRIELDPEVVEKYIDEKAKLK
jgi:hypothetical protein